MKKVILMSIMMMIVISLMTSCSLLTSNKLKQTVQENLRYTTPVVTFPDFVDFYDRTDTSKSKIKRDFKLELSKNYIDHFIDGNKVYLLLGDGTENCILWIFTDLTFETKNIIDVGNKASHVYVEDNTVYVCKDDVVYMYDKNTLELTDQRSKPLISSSFVVYDGIMYIINQNGILGIPPSGSNYHAQTNNVQSLCVNKEDGILYAAGKSSLHAFNLPDLEPISNVELSRKQEIAHVVYAGGRVHTASTLFNKNDISKALGYAEVDTDTRKGTLFANDQYILTREGVFDCGNLELILPMAHNPVCGFLTPSGYVFTLNQPSGKTITIRNINDHIKEKEKQTFYTLVNKDDSITWKGTPKVTSYQLEGNVVDMVGKDNICYAITSSPNKLLAFRVDTMELLYSLILPSTPGRIMIYDEELMVTIPELKIIKGFNMRTSMPTKDIELEHPPRAFGIHNGYLYYTSLSLGENVFKQNLEDNTTEQIIGPARNSDMVINNEDNLIYIATYNCLVAIDIEKFDIISKTEISLHRIRNLSRKVYYVDNTVYSLGYAFNKDNLKRPTKTYKTDKDEMRILFANHEYVIAFDGIYKSETEERLVPINIDFSNTLIESGYFLGYETIGNKLYVGSLSSMIEQTEG